MTLAAHFGAGVPHARVLPDPSLNRSANGMPSGTASRYAVHFRQPGPGVLPLAPHSARTLDVRSDG